jgi:hypothetical protein
MILGVIVAIVVLTSLIVFLWPWPPHGGLSQADAIQIAWKNVNLGATAVASTELRRDFNTGFDLPVHRWSWVVIFSGQ